MARAAWGAAARLFAGRDPVRRHPDAGSRGGRPAPDRSGNIGATNVLRTGRKGLAAATLLLDAAKGATAVLLAESLFPGTGVVAAAGAFLGHLYPVWLGFKGGKGVATMMGIVLALHWPSALVYAAVWLGLLAALRISSVAGILAAVSAPVGVAWFGRSISSRCCSRWRCLYCGNTARMSTG